jgi:hypothetical protein
MDNLNVVCVFVVVLVVIQSSFFSVYVDVEIVISNHTLVSSSTYF